MRCGGADATSACQSRRLRKSLPADDQTPELSTRDVDVLLAQLKPQQREIVQSLSINGSSIRDTADRLKMTEGAVRVALYRALKALSVVYRRSPGED
jgi:DNA-directed RNA polymerase specialized sigma24 family protein